MAETDTTPADAALDERALVDGLLAGDAAAVRRFLERTHHPAWCLACRVTRDADERRDWSSNALLGILDDLKRGRFEYRRPGSFWAWFRKRVYFRLLDERRRALTRQRREPSADADTAMDLAEYGAPGDASDEFERVEVAAAVEDCLERIPHLEQRRSLRLLLHEELAYQAIAETIGAPINSVRVWILRGRIALRRCLAQRWGLVPAEGGDGA